MVALILVLAVFAACKKDDAGTSSGKLLDSITMIGVEEAVAVTQLTAGAINVFAGSLPGEYLKEIEAAGLDYCTSTGLSYEIMLNNADTVPVTGMFNPFSIREIREALNWLIDRDYIVQEIFGGAAIPRQFAVSSVAPDYARYIEYARVTEANYTYNKDRAVTAIDTAMTAAGIEKDADGKWAYDGAPIMLTFYIRTEDGLRQPIGDYVANELEDIGFTVDRLYRLSSECSPVVFGSDPFNGEWNLYTGAWGASGLVRDSAIEFHDMMHPDSRYGYNPWTAFELPADYGDVLTKLANTDFTTMDERADLFKIAFDGANYNSTRLWLVDGLAYTPWNANVSTSYNLSAGVDGSSMTAYTMLLNDQEGGDLVWANSSPPFVNSVNAIAGTNWTYDNQFLNFTRDYLAIGDPFTGLQYPKRIKDADVVIKDGLPVGTTYDWVNLTFAAEIAVPDDAMIDWDVATSTWITADANYLAGQVTKMEAALADAEAAVAAADEESKENAEFGVTIATDDLATATENADRGYLVAKRKTTLNFAEDFKDFTWHDGTPVTMADIMMRMIMDFATAYEDSPYYDAYVAPSFLSTQPSFKGWKIISEDPIVVEIYKDDYALDAEANVSDIEGPSWTYDSTGSQASWHEVAISNRVIESGKATYSEGAADAEDTIEWLNLLDGPCLEYMSTAVAELLAEGYIPFEPTMGKYVTADEAKTAYQNTMDFYTANGHYVIGMGPYYISSVLSTEGSVTLSAYEGYMEPADRWAFLSTPKLATVDVEGPTSVKADKGATFKVNVTDPNGDKYPAEDIGSVKYLLFDSTGTITEVVDVEAKKDGLYEIDISAASIGALGNGSCKIEIVVSPLAVAAPSITAVEFVVE